MGKKKKEAGNRITVPDSNNPLLLTYISFGVLGILAFMLSMSTISGDDDVFWHLATGRWIWQHKAVPSQDVFGLIRQNQEWIPFEWGWDVLTYFIYSISNTFTAIQLLPGVIWLGITAMLVRLMKRLAVSTPVILATVMLTLVISLDRMTPRPHMISILGYAIISYTYFSFRYFSPSAVARLYLLPPLFFVWANMHPGVLGGLLMLLVILISEIFLFISKRRRLFDTAGAALQPLDMNMLGKISFIFLLSAAAMVLNPHGAYTYVYVYSHTKLALLTTIKEWIPPFGDLSPTRVLLAYKIAVFIGCVSFLYSLKKKEPLPAFLYIAFTLYSLRAVRFIADYAVVTAVGTALGFQYFIRYSLPALYRFMEKKIVTVVLTLFMAYAIIAIPQESFYIEQLYYYRHFGLGIDTNFFSLPLFNFLNAHNISGRPFNTLEVGGLLIWERPEEKDFIDSRNLSDESGRMYYSFLYMQPGFEDRLRLYGIDYMILHPIDLLENPAAMQKTPISYCSIHRDEWKLVYWDDLGFLYLKNVPKFKPVIEQFAYHVLDPYLFSFRRATFDSLKNASPELFRQELKRKSEEEPQGILFNNISQNTH